MTVAAAVAIFALFQWLGSALGSDRGQFGLLIAPIIVMATAMCDRLIAPAPWREVFGRLGLGRPAARGLVAAAAIAFALSAVVPLYGRLTHGRVDMYPGWIWLLPGLFAQAGIAEETLFRGFLYRRYRHGRTFAAAVAASAVPFALAHVPLFFLMAPQIAVAALALSLISTAPFAQAFEIGGRSIWPPAILHFVMQGGIKVMTLAGGESAAALPSVWMSACAIVPYGLFFLSRHEANRVS